MKYTNDIWLSYITFCVACYQLPFMIWYNYQKCSKN